MVDSDQAKLGEFSKKKIILKEHKNHTEPGLVYKFRDISLTGNWQSRPLFTKKKFCKLSRCCFCADRAQNLSRPAPNNILRLPQISSKSAHFRRSYTERTNIVQTRCKVFSILGEGSSLSN